MFYPCHNNNNSPHQNLFEGGTLEVRKLTHKLLIGFWVSLGGWGQKGPMSKEEQEQQSTKSTTREHTIYLIVTTN